MAMHPLAGVCTVTPWVKRLIIANIVVFFLQQTVATATGRWRSFRRWCCIRPWTVITYMFVHASITHILFNMLGLYFFGPRVEERLGSNRFITLYCISGITGAVLSMIFAPMAPIIGASGAVLGVMFAFARFWPTAQIYVFGILPIEARLAVDSVRAVHDLERVSRIDARRCRLRAPRRVRRRVAVPDLSRPHALERSSFRKQAIPLVGKDILGNWKRVDPKAVHEVNRDEVNRILDKISAKGLGSLTPQERLFLSNFVPPDDRVPPVS